MLNPMRSLVKRLVSIEDKAIQQWGKSDLVLFLSINGRGNKPVEVKEFLVGLPAVMSLKAKD